MNTEAIDNLIARMQRAEQERDALRETVLSIGAQRDELLSKLDAAMKERDAALALANINVESELLVTRAKLDASERAASEMRRCLEHFQDEREAAQLGVPNEVLDALSSDAGRDYVPRHERDLAQTHVAALQKDCADLRAKLDASERAASVMREALADAENALANSYDILEWPAEPDCQAWKAWEKAKAALSSDAGRDYVPRSEVDAAWRKGMTDAANLVQTTAILSDEGERGTDAHFHKICDTFEQAILAARDAKKAE